MFLFFAVASRVFGSSRCALVRWGITACSGVSLDRCRIGFTLGQISFDLVENWVRDVGLRFCGLIWWRIGRTVEVGDQLGSGLDLDRRRRRRRRRREEKSGLCFKLKPVGSSGPVGWGYRGDLVGGGLV